MAPEKSCASCWGNNIPGAGRQEHLPSQQVWTHSVMHDKKQREDGHTRVLIYGPRRGRSAGKSFSCQKKKQKQEDKCEEGINSDPTSVTLETGSMRGDCSLAEEGLPHSLTAKEGAMMCIWNEEPFPGTLKSDRFQAEEGYGSLSLPQLPLQISQMGCRKQQAFLLRFWEVECDTECHLGSWEAWLADVCLVTVSSNDRERKGHMSSLVPSMRACPQRPVQHSYLSRARVQVYKHWGLWLQHVWGN